MIQKVLFKTSYYACEAFDMPEFAEGFKKLVPSLNGKVTAGTLLRKQCAKVFWTITSNLIEIY